MQQAFDQTLAAHNKSDVLDEAMRYSLMNGGKMLRSSLCLMTCEMLGGKKEDAIAAGVALECIHTYSLIHDDLPTMDDDDLRRGKPSNHKVFGEAMAILAGDGLQGMAFLKVSESYTGEMCQRLCKLLSSAAVKMVAGQSLDVQQVGLDEYEGLMNMQALKTGAMFKAAVLVGAVVAGLEEETKEWNALEDYSKALGAAFQISDDILDVTQPSEALGKTAGKDAANKKHTIVSHLELHDAKNTLTEVLDQANGHLDIFGSRADLHRELLTFIRDRQH